MSKHVSDRDLNDADEIQQAYFYDRLQERCDELASQLYAMQTKLQNAEHDANFYKKMYEATLDSLFSYV